MENQFYDKEQVDILLTKPFDYTDGEILDKTIYKINNIEELRKTEGKFEGQVIELLGYYDADDKAPSIKYVWSYTKQTDDGGSVVNSLNGSWIAAFNSIINALNFGVSNLNNDNSIFLSSIQNYLSSQKNITRRITLVIPELETVINTSKSLLIPYNVNLEMNTILNYTGEVVDNFTFLTIGESGVSNARSKLLIAITSSKTDWSKTNFEGVRIYNSETSVNYNIDLVKGFSKGAVLMADVRGFVYNVIKFGQFLDNRIDVYMTTKNNGWINENLFLGGRFQRSQNSYTTLDKYGIWITSEDETYVNNNQNNFIKPSFEYHYKGTGDMVPIVIEHGKENNFRDVRCESGSIPALIRTLNDSTDNVVDVGYSNLSSMSYKSCVQDLGNYPVTNINFRKVLVKNSSIRNLVYNSGDLSKKIFSPDDISSYISDELFFTASSIASPLITKTRSTGVVVNSGYVTIPTSCGISVRIDTNNSKRFVIKRTMKGVLNLGRVNIKCYNSDGVVLTNDKVYVRGQSTLVPAYNTIFGGVWRMGSDNSGPFYINLHDDVAYIDVIIGGTVSDIIGFQIESIETSSNVIELYNKRGYYSSVKPTTLKYESGTIAYNNGTDRNILGWYFNGSVWSELITGKAVTISPTTTADATDLATALTLVNELKAKNNDLLAKLKSAGIMSNT